jgi:two-component system OmpR family sensor kinase
VPEEVRPLVNSFNSLLRRLGDAFATQRRFVQDAAHELRTPITAIGLQLENLRTDMTCEAAQGRYTQLELGVRRAQRLVDQLLRLSRQEAAGADGPGMVDLQAQLRESINTLITLADQRHIDLGLVAAGAVLAAPPTLRCAPGDLRSVLDNLIENALRYTPEGGVVDVRLLQDQGRVAWRWWTPARHPAGDAAARVRPLLPGAGRRRRCPTSRPAPMRHRTRPARKPSGNRLHCRW